MSYEEKLAIANVVQGFYFFSVLLMFLAALEKARLRGLHNLNIKEKGELWGSAVANITFLIVQTGGAFGLINTSDFVPCPVSFFIFSISYNLYEYAGIDVFEYILKYIKEKK